MIDYKELCQEVLNAWLHNGNLTPLMSEIALAIADDQEDWRDHPSLTARERNPWMQ